MTTTYWIVIGILVVALLGLIIGSAVAFKKINHTLNNVKNIQSNIQIEMEGYTAKADIINQRVQQLNNRASAMTVDVEQKMNLFTELSKQSNDFGQTLTYLNDHKSEFAKDIAKTSGQEVKKNGPKYLKLIGRTLKKTFNKQKNRYTS